MGLEIPDLQTMAEVEGCEFLRKIVLMDCNNKNWHCVDQEIHFFKFAPHLKNEGAKRKVIYIQILAALHEFFSVLCQLQFDYTGITGLPHFPGGG